MDDIGRARLRHAGDVLPNRAVEQRDVLRQVADIDAEAFALPQKGAVAVEIDPAGCRLPDADQQAGQGRFALPAAEGPMMPSVSPGSSENEMPLRTGRSTP